MDIFENLENLPVSEECFNDIMGIVESILDTVYGKSSNTTMEPTKPDVKSYKKNFSSKAEVAKDMKENKKRIKKEEIKKRIDRDINTKGYEEQEGANSDSLEQFENKHKVKNAPPYHLMDNGHGHSVAYNNKYYSDPEHKKDEEDATKARSIVKHYKKSPIKNGKDSELVYKAKQALNNYRKKRGLNNHLTNKMRNDRKREVTADYYWDATH